MDGIVSLRPAGRKRLMEMYRKHPDPAVRQRAHMMLLLVDGRSWSEVESVVYCSRRTIARWKERIEQGGIEALIGRQRGRQPAFGAWLATLVVTWVTTKFSRDFGFVRSRWTCECLALLALEFGSTRVSRETVRRWLHREHIVWPRPRPVLPRVSRRRVVPLR